MEIDINSTLCKDYSSLSYSLDPLYSQRRRSQFKIFEVPIHNTTSLLSSSSSSSSSMLSSNLGTTKPSDYINPPLLPGYSNRRRRFVLSAPVKQPGTRHGAIDSDSLQTYSVRHDVIRDSSSNRSAGKCLNVEWFPTGSSIITAKHHGLFIADLNTLNFHRVIPGDYVRVNTHPRDKDTIMAITRSNRFKVYDLRTKSKSTKTSSSNVKSMKTSDIVSVNSKTQIRNHSSSGYGSHSQSTSQVSAVSQIDLSLPTSFQNTGDTSSLLAVSQSGRYAALCDGSKVVNIVDTTGKQCKQSGASIIAMVIAKADVTSIRFVSEELLLLSNCNGFVEIHSILVSKSTQVYGEDSNSFSKLIKSSKMHIGECLDLAIDPDKRSFLTCGSDAAICQCDLTQMTHSNHIYRAGGRVLSVDYSFDGSLAAFSVETSRDPKKCFSLTSPYLGILNSDLLSLLWCGTVFGNAHNVRWCPNSHAVAYAYDKIPSWAPIRQIWRNPSPTRDGSLKTSAFESIGGKDIGLIDRRSSSADEIFRSSGTSSNTHTVTPQDESMFRAMSGIGIISFSDNLF